MTLFVGQSHLPGTRVLPAGTCFALYSSAAESADLLLFDSAAHDEPREILPMERHEGDVFQAFAPGARPGTLYVYRVRGAGFDEDALLLDPRARAIARGRAGILGIVTDPAFEWGEDVPPRVPWRDTVLYEAHIKTLTALQTEIPARERGTYTGFAHPAIIAHLKRLGVTTVELMPIQASFDEPALTARGLVNFWGYNTVNFFAPDPRFAVNPREPLDVISEFKSMVREYHRAGLEIILDVVYNHTAESDENGPLLSYRGIDDRAYYRYGPEGYLNWSGCGNTYNTDHGEALALLLDSLRYWVREMHVDGFRFDLAAALSRNEDGFNAHSNFIRSIARDPLLSHVKLIAEPWSADLGPREKRIFPAPWREWNADYPKTMRRFWRGDSGLLGSLATRLAGSSDRVHMEEAENESTERVEIIGPHGGINFITCHDGFTLRDLVSYREKHNEANGEDNRDGVADNFSWNEGVEGPSQDPAVREARARAQRNLMASLLLSQGVPMLFGGDEFFMTRLGNNNAYCQDNELNYADWTPREETDEFQVFLRRTIRLRKIFTVLRHRRFLSGPRPGPADVIWFRADGREMKTPDWEDPGNRGMGMLLPYIRRPALSLLVLINGSGDSERFTLPGAFPGREYEDWKVILDTDSPRGRGGERVRGHIQVPGACIRVLRPAKAKTA